MLDTYEVTRVAFGNRRLDDRVHGIFIHQVVLRQSVVLHCL